MTGVLLASDLKTRVQSISTILFEVAISHLECRYILELQSVTYCFQVTVAFTSASVLEKSRPEHIWGGFDLIV